jgi:hypothetical protein
VAIRSWSRENVPPLDQVARDKVERDVREWEPFFEAVRGFFGIPNPNPQDPNLSRQTDGFRSYRVGERSLSWNLDDDPAPTPAPPAVPSPFPDFESPNPTPTQEGPSGTGTSGTGTSGGVGVGESGFGSASEGQY